MTTRRINRKQTGSTTMIFLVLLIPIVLMIGMFAVDLMHFNAVQAEIQRASDAGALAGAKQLWQYNTNQALAVQAATSVSGWNDVDGQQLNSYPGVSINSTIETTPNFTGSPPSLGAVRCTVRFPYKNIWSTLFNAPGQVCQSSAVAGPQGSTNEILAGGLWPIAVSIDVPDQVTGQPLYQRNIGDVINLQWHNNCEWTGFNVSNATTVQSYELAYNNPDPNSQNTPSPVVTVNSVINLTRGVQASNVNAMSSQVGDVLVMPVVSDSGSLGPGNYTVIGFIGVQVQSVAVNGANSQLTGVLVPPFTASHYLPTAPQVGSTGNAAWDTFLRNSHPIASSHLAK